MFTRYLRWDQLAVYDLHSCPERLSETGNSCVLLFWQNPFIVTLIFWVRLRLGCFHRSRKRSDNLSEGEDVRTATCSPKRRHIAKSIAVLNQEIYDLLAGRATQGQDRRVYFYHFGSKARTWHLSFNVEHEIIER